jgi:predicted alpha/beta superfamily hydrolase
MLTAFLGLALAALGPPGVVRVQFVVITPDLTRDSPEKIYLATSLDRWRADGHALLRIAPGVYADTLELGLETRLEYKFTRTGAWGTVEKAADGGELPNRVLVVDPNAAEQVIVHAVARWADRAPAMDRKITLPVTTTGPAPSQAAGKSTATGDIRIHRDFESPQLKNRRTVIVWLPPGYDDAAAKDERYPVLYMHDGQNIFDAATSFAGEWEVDETAARLIRAGRVPKLIIVGVYNNADRMSEYTPVRDAERGGGRGDEYLAFLVDTVKPFIDRTYRTQSDRAHTAIAGSSLGGLISLYAAAKRPDVFGAAGVISPALMWGERGVLSYVREHPPQPRPRLWIDIGTAEGRADPNDSSVSPWVADCRALVELLEKQGYRRGVDFAYEEITGGEHNERAWATRFERVLEFLMAGKTAGGAGEQEAGSKPRG